MTMRDLPVGTTLAAWKVEVVRLYPQARFQHEPALHKWHASLGLFRKGSWYGHYAGGPSLHTKAWVQEPK